MKKQTGKQQSRSKTGNTPDMLQVLPWILLAAAMLLVVYVRVRLISFPFERDEGEYAYFGQLILKGIPPYLEAYNLKLPGTYYSYALIMMLFGQSVEAIRAGILLFSLGTILLVYLSARKLFNPFTGVLAAFSAAILSLSWSFLGNSAHATHFVTFWAMLGLWLLLKGYDKGRGYWYLLAGISLGFAFLMKQSGIFFSIFGFILTGIHFLYRKEKNLIRTLGILLLYTAGAILPFLLTVLWISASGVMDQFRFWTMTYPAVYGTRLSYSQIPGTFLANIKPVLHYVLLLWITSGLGLVALLFYPGRQLNRLTLALFTIFSLANAIPGFYFRQHYFIPAIPALAMLTGIFFDTINQRYAARFRGIRTVTALVFALMLIPVLRMNKEMFFTVDVKILCDYNYYGNPFAASVPIAKFIKQNTSPGDRIFVFGSEPQIYFYSQRQSSTGYIYMYDLVFDHPFTIKMQNEMKTELAKHPPEMVVFASTRYSWLWEPHYADSMINWFNQYLNREKFDIVAIADIKNPIETNFVWGTDCRNYRPTSDNSLQVFRRMR